jgi:hypothetical protein
MSQKISQTAPSEKAEKTNQRQIPFSIPVMKAILSLARYLCKINA